MSDALSRGRRSGLAGGGDAVVSAESGFVVIGGKSVSGRETMEQLQAAAFGGGHVEVQIIGQVTQRVFAADAELFGFARGNSGEILKAPIPGR